MRIRKWDVQRTELTPEEVDLMEDQWIDMAVPYMGFISFELMPNRWLTLRFGTVGTWSIDDKPVVS